MLYRPMHPPQLGGIAGVEWIILLALILVVLFGSNKLPKIMRALGKAMGEFERGRAEIQRELMGLRGAAANPIAAASQTVQSSQASQPTMEAEEPVKPTRDRKFLLEMAKSLNVETENRSDEEIWEDIRRKVFEGRRQLVAGRPSSGEEIVGD